MRVRYLTITILVYLLLAQTVFGNNQNITVTKNLTSMPLAFTENKGQWDEQVLYRADAGGATMWFTKDGAVYQFTRTIESDDNPISVVDKRYGMPDDIADRSSGRQTPSSAPNMMHQPDSIESIAVKANFVGANSNPQMSGVDMMEYKCNYFIGNDPNEWHTDVANYSAVIYEQVYDGIDLKYYGNGKQMEYDFIVSPGADYSQIKIQYEGVKSLSVNTAGELVVETDWGEVVEQKPIIYQIENGSRIAVSGDYDIKGTSSFGFELNNYNPTLPLVIDPVLSYSTYLGGGFDDRGCGISVDASGNAYVTGYTQSTDFPTENPFQTDQGGDDVFVTKLSSTGNSLIYSTYLGGGSDEWGIGISVDASGNAYVTGHTVSTDFPTENPFQTYQVGNDVFVAKLSDDPQPNFCDGFTGLFCDDFEDGVITDWQSLQNDGCSWTEADGIISTSISGMQQWCIQSVGDNNWENYIFEAKVRGNTGVDKVLVFRIQDSNNFYAVNLRSDYPLSGIDQVTFDKMENGIYTADIGTADYSSENGIWYNLKVACADNSFKVYVNDAFVMEYTDNDNPYYTGGVGIACWTGLYGSCDISFDDVMVTDPFPVIKYDNITGVETGQLLTIDGHLEYSDGSIYTPLLNGTIGCEDPVSLMSRNVSVDAGGSFHLTTIDPVTYPSLYDFVFIANYEDMSVSNHLFVPISNPPDPIHPPVQTELEVGVGNTKTSPEINRAISVKFPLVSSWDLIASTATEFYQLGKTAWQRTTTSSTGKIITGLRNQAFDDCSWSFSDWGGCMLGVDFYSLQIIQASQPFSLMDAAFNNTWNRLRDDGYLTQSDVDWLNAYLSVAGIIQGLYKINLAKEYAHGIVVADKLSKVLLTNSKLLIKKFGLKNGEIDELLVQVEDVEGNIYIVYLHPKWENMTRISSWCPVDLIVSNPEGFIVSKAVNEIPGAEYIEADLNNDGQLEDQILIPDTVYGLYTITVLPDSSAQPSDSFSLFVDNSYYSERIILAQDELISNIPLQPYEITTFENEPPITFDIISPNDTTFLDAPNISFQWESTTDPNPDHSVTYDLIIASDTSFSDSIVFYDQKMTSIIIDSLPLDSLDHILYWKIRAHDLWGASTYSNQTYLFEYLVCIDSDGDGYGDPGNPENYCTDDNCPGIGNLYQEDSDLDGIGDSCDVCINDSQNDIDEDAICGDLDNCPNVSNEDQANSDLDSLGDACDNCPMIDNNDQANNDSDTLGNVCDNCQDETNNDQLDTDGDDIGDVCDGCCQLRGDVAVPKDDLVLVNDLVWLVNYLFKGGTDPSCIDEGDCAVPLDGNILVNDLVWLVNYLFKGGDAPPEC